jgi:hypothetical protein
MKHVVVGSVYCSQAHLSYVNSAKIVHTPDNATKPTHLSNLHRNVGRECCEQQKEVKTTEIILNVLI